MFFQVRAAARHLIFFTCATKMAKSKRSKIKRKFRAERRHKAKPKSLEQLKKIINLPIGGTGLPYVDASKTEVVVIPKEQGLLDIIHLTSLNSYGNGGS